jgi:hypothetical protein
VGRAIIKSLFHGRTLAARTHVPPHRRPLCGFPKIMYRTFEDTKGLRFDEKFSKKVVFCRMRRVIAAPWVAGLWCAGVGCHGSARMCPARARRSVPGEPTPPSEVSVGNGQYADQQVFVPDFGLCPAVAWRGGLAKAIFSQCDKIAFARQKDSNREAKR